jgi:hypothetical protein
MSYLHRDALGGLSPVATDPPTPERAIMDAHRAAIAGPVPDDWQTALAALVTELAHVQRLTAERAMLLRIAYAAWSLSDEIDEFGAPVSSETMNELDVALLEQFGGPDRDWLVVRGNIRAALRELEARHG